MKAKFLFILLSVLFIIPTSAAILNKHKHKIRLTSFTLRNKATTRSPIEFNIRCTRNQQLLANYLSVTSCRNAEITITDKNGKTVVHEPPTFINKGKTLYIETPNGYPYTVKIISPIMDITGDIIEEESE